ncbi:MAG: right-handed parallel beta-helix repeat-containing protein [Planctomycetota bacterium]
MMRRLCFVLMFCLAALTSAAQAVDRYANPGNFHNQFAAAQPGDRVILAPGTYGRYWLPNKHGAPGNLIQVIAQDPMNRPVFDAGGNSEGLQIASCSYILFDGLIVRGATVEGIHLQSAGGPASNHIIMKNVTVTMPSTSGNTDNWKSDYTSNTLFYNCTADVNGDAGFDFMGTTDSLVMRSTMTGGNCGIHAKNGAHNMGFYKNHFDNAGERNFQFGGNGLYNYDQIAMGNVLVGPSPQSVVYTTARYDEFRYNTVENPNGGGAVIRILNEGAATPPTGENTFSNNLVEYVGMTVAWPGPNTDPASFTFADNFWSKPPTLPAPETGGVVGDPQLNAEHLPTNPAARDYGAHAPAMEAAWAAYTNRFAWAWSYAQQYEPRAEPGSHQIAVGGSIVVDGRGSYAGTGSYGDYAIGMGLGEGAHDLGLRVRITNEMGQYVYDEGWGALTVVPEPTALLLLGIGAAAALRRRQR